MPVIITYDFQELIKFNDSLQNLLASMPSVKSTLLRNIVAKYRTVIQNRILTQNIRYTGTYEDSIRIAHGGTEDEPIISIVMEPTGPGASRLPIYWKVLEFGANPSPNVLSAPIIEWAGVKGASGRSTLDGIRIANSIRSRGISPHPILSSIFVLSRPSGEVVGLTTLAESIAEAESDNLINNLVQTYYNPTTGQKLIKSKITGRFQSQG